MQQFWRSMFDARQIWDVSAGEGNDCGKWSVYAGLVAAEITLDGDDVNVLGRAAGVNAGEMWTTTQLQLIATKYNVTIYLYSDHDRQITAICPDKVETDKRMYLVHAKEHFAVALRSEDCDKVTQALSGKGVGWNSQRSLAEWLLSPAAIGAAGAVGGAGDRGEGAAGAAAAAAAADPLGTSKKTC
jgi:hypothetical protein